MGKLLSQYKFRTEDSRIDLGVVVNQSENAVFSRAKGLARTRQQRVVIWSYSSTIGERKIATIDPSGAEIY